MECATTRRFFALIATVCSALFAPSISAHPHMWIDAKAEFVFDDQARLSSIKQTWRFDDLFSPYAMQGVKKGADGKYPAATLKSMANDWMDALGEPISHFFTRVRVNDETLGFAAPQNARLRWDNTLNRLELAFTLPLAKPVALSGRQALIDIYDPTYFVAYDFAGNDVITLSRAPAECARKYIPPRELDYATMQQLAAIPPDPDPSALPEELFAITKGLTHRIEIEC